MYLKVKIAIFIGIIFFLFQGCEKNEKHPLPNVDVDLYINLSYAENVALNTPGGSKIFNQGINGIIVFRIDNSTFGAYEITCPYESETMDCYVEVNGVVARCPCCGSEYFLNDNSILKGPTKWPLKSYYTDFTGIVLLVTN